MRKIIIISVLVLCAVVVEGIVFFLSSRVPAEAEVAEYEMPPSSSFTEMLASAEQCREQRRFDAACGFVRLALDRAETERERVIAGYKMGCLLFEDYQQGGDSQPGAAALYLQAAYDCSDNVRQQIMIGLVLLDVFLEINETDQFIAYLEEMLSEARTPDQMVELWQRKFAFLVGPHGDWLEMSAALAVAESLPLQSAEWAASLKDMQLRAREKLLVDAEWFELYVQTLAIADPTGFRQELFAEIRSKLERIIQNGEAKAQEEALLRLANALVAVDNYEEGHACLKRFLETEPTENLTDALMLLSRISRVRGEVAYTAQLAESLIRRFDFNKHTRDEVLQVILLLEEHELYDDALDLLEGCFSLADAPGKEYGKLIGQAAVLEERVGRRSDALNYMNQLHGLEADQAFGEAFSKLIELNMVQSDYESVEHWIHRFFDKLSPHSEAYKNALFALFEAKYWLDRPVLEQLFVGFAAVQATPEDARTASVELRMARYIEEMKLNDLAVSYYNRIGLLNFFQGDSLNSALSLNIGEQAMLGKARCLKKMEDWAAADHLYRDLCNRTQSPLVKSEAAVGWAELALRFGQKREAERRYDLAYVQMLSGAGQVRYTLGRLQLEGEERFRDPTAMEESLALLSNLPEEEQRDASIVFFNDTFDFLHKAGDERAMGRMIDLAYQSDYTEWLPILSYVLRLHEGKFQREKMAGLGVALREKDEVAGASMVDLARVVTRLEELADLVKRHKKKAIK